MITNPLISFSDWDATTFFSKLISNGIGLFFVIAAVVFVFMMVWGGVQWILSGGDKAAVQAAQQRITHAIIGLVVLLSTYAIIFVLGEFFGLEVFKNFTIDISSLKINP